MDAKKNERGNILEVTQRKKTGSKPQKNRDQLFIELYGKV